MGTPTHPLKAAIYDPYLDSLGGGERYCLTIAEILLRKHWQVDLLWSGDRQLINQAQDFFSLDLNGLNLVPNIFSDRPKNLGPIQTLSDTLKVTSHATRAHHLVKRFFSLRQYDLLIFLGDGSIPFLFAKKNLLHIQVPLRVKFRPFQKVQNFIKLLPISQVIFNSSFTTKHTLYIPKSKSVILYPPVDIDKFFSSTNKENIILSVGRFDDILNIKRQDVLIEAFKTFCHQHPSWKLILAGGTIKNPQLNHYLSQLQRLAQGYPIEFLVKPSFDDLKKIYSQAKIYWHAAGYGVDQDNHPEMTEHFGITLVEAMASGAVPIATDRGGLPEIIDHNINGFLWEDQDTLISHTHKLINSPQLLNTMSQQAIKKAQSFSKDQFEAKFIELLHLQP